MSEETLRILKLLEGGKISSQEAENLLSALKAGAGETEAGDDPVRSFRHRFHHHDRYHGTHPGRIVAEVMREVNPAGIAAEAIELAREKMALAREEMESVRGSLRPPRPPKPPRPPRFAGLEALAEIGECCLGRASAEQEQTVTVPAAGIAALSLSQPRSDITVRSEDTDQITVTAAIKVWAGDRDEAEERLKSLKLATENDGGTLRVKLEGPPWTKKRHASADFRISLPRTVKVELGTASGDIEVSGCHAGAKLATASGDISLSDCRGDVSVSSASGDIALADCPELKAQVQTASGDIELTGCAGSASLHTVSGDAEIGLEGDLSATSVSGDLRAGVAGARNVVVHSTSGDVDLDISSAAPGLQLALVSISGDVSLELPGGISAKIEAATTSGDIDCDLELADAERKNRRLAGRLGDGAGRITVTTTSGDITIS